MPKVRRNQITYEEERYSLGLGVVAGIGAALSGASPTGTTWIDAVLIVAFTILVTWASASASWWALLASSGVVTVAAIGGPIWVLVLGLVALGAAAWVAGDRMNQPLIRAGIGGVVANVAMRLELDAFFLASALVAGVAMGLLVAVGVRRRRKHVRKRIYWGGAVVVGLALLAIGALGFAAIQAQETARDGYIGLLDGLEFVQDGDVAEAEQELRDAADDLASASDSIGGVFGMPAQFVPGIAQNRNAGVDIIESAADAALSAADALAVVDLDQLTVSGGVIDVFAFEALEAPLADLEQTIVDLDDALHDADTPWLVSPLASRLDNGLDRADQARGQIEATAAAARVAPDMLGADGPRRYFVAFVNAAEARGTSGLMGNWSEIVIDNGRIDVTENGRSAQLQDESLERLQLDMSDEYFARYGFAGAQSESGGVIPKFWSNVTMPPHMPSVGSPMKQMYEQATGREVDGVFVIDAAGLAALLEVTGPVEIEIEVETDPELASDTDAGSDDDGSESGEEEEPAEPAEPEVVTEIIRIDSGNAEEFLTLGQYEFAENEREDLLSAVTEATVENLLNETLPPPQQMAPILAPAVLHGHISGWAVEAEEQELFQLVGMDGELPVVGQGGVDAFAVTTNNASGNKIESFLERRIEYRPVVDQSSGNATATMRVEFTNTAPTTGYPDYVIGNIIDLPTGTNRMLVDVHTKMLVTEALVDGVRLENPLLNPELGYWVTTYQIDVPAGETVVLELTMEGDLDEGPYQLVYRPQPLPNTDTLVVDADTPGGGSIWDYEGQPERRSLLNANGISAWR